MRRRGFNDRGAVLLEAAVVCFILVLLAGAAFEFGLAFRTRQTLASATRAGARAASQSYNDPQTSQYSDLFALQAVYNSLIGEETGRQQLTNVRRIVIFNQGTLGGSANLPAECLTGFGGRSQICNVYTPAQLTAAATNNNLQPTSVSLDASYYSSDLWTSAQNWCPVRRTAGACSTPTSGRNDGDLNPAGNKVFDNIGIYIEVDRQSFFPVMETILPNTQDVQSVYVTQESPAPPSQAVSYPAAFPPPPPTTIVTVPATTTPPPTTTSPPPTGTSTSTSTGTSTATSTSTSTSTGPTSTSTSTGPTSTSTSTSTSTGTSTTTGSPTTTRPAATTTRPPTTTTAPPPPPPTLPPGGGVG